MMWQVFEGTMGIADKLAQMLYAMSSIEVSQERIVNDEEKLLLDISEELPISELIPDLAARTKKLVNCDRTSIFVLHRDENVLCTILSDSTEMITIPVDLHSMAGECAVHGRKINQHDAYKHPSFNPAIDKKTGYRTHAMLVMPIRRYNSESAPIIGVVQCINTLSGGEGAVYTEDGTPVFTAEDENHLSQFCLQIAAPLEKVWQNKKPPRAKNELGNDWVENIRVLAQLDVYTVMRVILDRMRTLTDADRASLFVLDRKRKELWTKITEDAPEIRLKSNTGIVGAVATEGEPLNILDAYKDPRFNRKIDVATGYRTKSILCLPIKNQRGQVIGVIQCINKKSGPAFTLEDMQNLDEFSWQVPAPRLAHDADDAEDADDVISVSAGARRARALTPPSPPLFPSPLLFPPLLPSPLCPTPKPSPPPLVIFRPSSSPLVCQVATMLEFKAAMHQAEDGGLASIVGEVSTGDGVALLLHLVQSPDPQIQLNAAACLGYISRCEWNRERVVELGGVPVLLELATPYPWRQQELLRGIALCMANLCMSPAVRLVAEEQGGWKSLLSLAQSTRVPSVQKAKDESEGWFDALRALANLALHPPLQKAMVGAGALNVAFSYAMRDSSDLQVQALRLAGNLSECVSRVDGSGYDASVAASFSRTDVIKKLGSVAFDAPREALPDVAAAYAKLARVEAIALWLFNVEGTGLLEKLAHTSGSLAEDTRVRLVAILATCLQRRPNQRIALDMRRSHDPTDPAFRDASTAKQRQTLMREREELKTAKEVRSIMVRVLNSGSRNPNLFAQYARVLMELAREVTNHKYMLKQGYVEQLFGLAAGLGVAIEAQVFAMQGLRLLATAEGEHAIDSILIKFATTYRIIPLLVAALSAPHEGTRIEVCRLVRALATENEVARMLVAAAQAPPPSALAREQPEDRVALTNLADAKELAEFTKEPPPKPTPFLAILGSLLTAPSRQVQIEACQALEPLCANHKVQLCQARVVGALIALTQSTDKEVVEAAARVLHQLN